MLGVLLLLGERAASDLLLAWQEIIVPGHEAAGSDPIGASSRDCATTLRRQGRTSQVQIRSPR